MKNSISLSIQKPCSEQFGDFQPTELGGFCQSCQKEVIDFSKMSDQEILIYFKNKQGKTCGRFLDTQLKTYSEFEPSRRKWNYSLFGMGLMSFSLASLFSVQQGQAQHQEPTTSGYMSQNQFIHKQPTESNNEHPVEGKVIDETTAGIPGVAVVLKGSEIGTVTDADGNFKFPKPLNIGDVLIFSSVGYVTKEYIVSEDTPVILNITMTYFDNIDGEICIFVGEVSVDQVYHSKPSFWQKIKSFFK